jgi:hypothetical protein
MDSTRAPDVQLADGCLEPDRRPVPDFAVAQFNRLQGRTKPQHGQIAQRPVVEMGHVELLHLRQNLLRVLRVLARKARFVSRIQRAFLPPQNVGLEIGLLLDALLLFPEADGVFDEQLRPEALLQRTLRVTGPVGKVFR